MFEYYPKNFKFGYQLQYSHIVQGINKSNTKYLLFIILVSSFFIAIGIAFYHWIIMHHPNFILVPIFVFLSDNSKELSMVVWQTTAGRQFNKLFNSTCCSVQYSVYINSN